MRPRRKSSGPEASSDARSQWSEADKFADQFNRELLPRASFSHAVAVRCYLADEMRESPMLTIAAAMVRARAMLGKLHDVSASHPPGPLLAKAYEVTQTAIDNGATPGQVADMIERMKPKLDGEEYTLLHQWQERLNESREDWQGVRS